MGIYIQNFKINTYTLFRTWSVIYLLCPNLLLLVSVGTFIDQALSGHTFIMMLVI